jgi:Flp pilus assembly protein TadD
MSLSQVLANLLADTGDFSSGLAIMSKAATDHPFSPIAHNNLAALIARKGNQTEAVKEFVKAINLDPTLPSAHYGLGLALLQLKAYPDAIKEFQTTVTLNPGILDLQNKIDLANRSNLRSLAYYQTTFN